MQTSPKVRRVYVAAPFEDAHRVCEIHERLRQFGIEPTSDWAVGAYGPEALHEHSADRLRGFALGNDVSIRRADAILVLARAGVGGEMFAEARYAWDLRKPIVWVGRRTLSAYREGVVLAEDTDDALNTIWSWS